MELFTQIRADDKSVFGYSGFDSLADRLQSTSRFSFEKKFGLQWVALSE